MILRHSILTLFIVFLSLSCSTNQKISSVVKNGEINLFDKDGIVKLNGEWKFYNAAFLAPEIINDEKFKNGNNIQVPGVWGKEDFGYGSYLIKIKGLSNLRSPTLQIKEIRSAFKLYFIPLGSNNNSIKLIAESGISSSNPKIFSPLFRETICHFPSTSDSAYIVIHASNFSVSNGGIKFPISLGSEKEIGKYRDTERALNFIVVGIVIFMTFYHLFLFLHLPEKKSYLLFGIFSFLMGTYIFLNPGYLIQMMPRPNTHVFNILLKSVYFCLIGGFPFLYLFLGSVFNQEFSKKIIRFFWLFSLIFSLAVFLPLRIFEPIFGFYQIAILIMNFYSMICIIHAVKNNQDASKISLIGFIIMQITVFHDILLDQQLINSIWLGSYGMVALLVSQSFVLSKLFAKTHRDMEYLSKNLEREVDNKTKDLELAHNTLKYEAESRTNIFINLAHETKTPLTIIKNSLSSLIKKYGTNEELDEIIFNIDLLTNNIINFLDSEKIKRGIIVYEHNNPINISQFLSQKLPAFIKYAENNLIKLNNTIEPNIFCKIDVFAFDRIINNLLDNAIKYNRINGTIDVELKSTNKIISLTVCDTGIGIDKSKLSEIFQPYKQVAKEKKNLQGLGMGLHITKEIINDANGEISVESSLDKGTTFKVTLIKSDPGSKDDKDFRDTMAIPNSNSVNHIIEDIINSPTSPTILLVEDNKSLLKSTANSLKEDYNILCAINGKEALNKLHATESTPSLIISDIMMDNMDGIEFRKNLLENDTYKNIPFIFITAKSGETDNLEGLEVGAIDYISKPFSTAILKAKIKSLINFNNLKQTLIDTEKLRSIGILTSTISHEIMNPLMGIEGPLAVLEENLNNDKIKNPEVVKDSLKFITKNLERIQQIVHTLRSINNKVEIFENINLEIFLNPIVTLFRERYHDRISIETNIPDNFIIQSNGNALSQIMINLLSNAADAINDKGTISITVDQLNNVKSLKVSDTGCGIKERDIPKIFDFSYTTKDQSKGTGVGLFIVKRLTKQLNIIVNVESEISIGTCFNLVFNDQK